MKKNETVIFELCSNVKSMYQDKYGNSRTTAKSVSIPAQASMLFFDEDGDSYVRTIRYVKSHKSVFIDEQQDIDPSVRITRQISKPQFTDGILAVKPSQKNLLDFLHNHPSNEANQHWGMERQKPVFRERNPVELARKANESNKKVINASRLVYDSDFVGKIVPIAQYLGYDTDKESDLVLWDVDNYARSNPERFIELLDSPVIQRHSDVGRAIKMGIIRLDGQRLLWADGRQILEAPTSYNVRDYFSEVSFDDQYHSVWAEVKRLMDKRSTPKEDIERIAAPKSTEVEQLNDMDVEQLAEKLRNSGVIKWQAPFYVIGNDKIKGKANLLEFVSENKKRLSAQLL